MKLILLLSALFALAVNAAPVAKTTSGSDEAELLAAAMQQAARSDLTDPALIRRLVLVHRDARAAASNRIMAGYLLTHVDEAKLGGSRLELVDYLLSQPTIESSVGSQGMLRLWRLKGDAEYHRGKFDIAVAAYERLRASAKGGLRDYAVLKLGWCHINAEKAGEAFALWSAEADKAIAEKRPVSNNLFHGLGQALTEKTDRRPEDVLLAGRLLSRAGADAAQAVVKGMVDGLNYLSTPALVDGWVRSLESFPARDAVARRVLEVSSAKGERACAVLGIAHGLDVTFTDAARLVESCTRELLASRQRNDARLTQVESVLRGIKASGEQRHARFSVLRALQRSMDACDEGLAWLVESPKLPVADVTQSCRDGARISSANGLAVAKKIDELVGTGSRLRRADEPTSFLVAGLLSEPSFAAPMGEMVKTQSSRYAATVLPALLAERLVQRGEIEKAETLAAALGNAATSNQAVWSEVRYRAIAKSLAAGNLAQTRERLQKDFPLAAPARPSREAQALWMALVAKGIATEPDSAWLRETVSALLEARRSGRFSGSPKGMDASLLEAAAHAGLWAELWPVLPAMIDGRGFPSERFEADLFEAIASGKFRPDSEPAGAAGRLASAAKPLVALDAQRPKAGKDWSSYPGKSALAKDLKLAATVSARRDKALKSTPDTVARITAWVAFLGRAPKEVGDRAWSCPQLRRFGSAVVLHFCRQAESELTTLKRPEGLGSGDWEKLTGSLSQRLAECRRSHERQAADGAQHAGNVGAPRDGGASPSGDTSKKAQSGGSAE